MKISSDLSQIMRNVNDNVLVARAPTEVPSDSPDSFAATEASDPTGPFGIGCSFPFYASVSATSRIGDRTRSPAEFGSATSCLSATAGAYWVVAIGADDPFVAVFSFSLARLMLEELYYEEKYF